MSPTMARKIVVAGATGKQGGALITALLSKSPQPFEIYAVTRNPASPSARSLAIKPNIKVIQGDFANPSAIFAQVEKPWALFSVTNPLNAHKEELQGKAMTAAAVEAGVNHIVFTATDRGGQDKSEGNPTSVPHFASKFNIEEDIKAHAARDPRLTWTFLRPVAFFENLTPDFFGKGFVATWRLNGRGRKLQMISTRDIGKIAAEAFLHSEGPEYKNRAISLAGDELSPDEAARVFKKVTGKELPGTYSLVGRALRWGLYEQLGSMFDWFVSDGFGVDVKGLRERYPFLKDFGTWVEEESAWKVSKA